MILYILTSAAGYLASSAVNPWPIICTAVSVAQLAADVYFIPVNYPAAEASALQISIVGAALYLAADIAVIAAAFSKEKEAV